MRLTPGRLHYMEFQRLLEGLERRLPGGTAAIVFDFAGVTELAGPWGVHLAQLIHLGRRTGVRIGVCNLSGRPRRIAELFAADPRVRAMLSDSAPGPARSMAAA